MLRLYNKDNCFVLLVMFNCPKRNRLRLDSRPSGRVREKVLTGENAGRNRVPSCAGSASGRGRMRADPDCWTGRWSA